MEAARPAPLHVPDRVGGPRRWWDWILAADPGLAALQAGWRSLVSMPAGLAAGYAMAQAVDVPAMFGLMVGGIMGLVTSIAVAENSALRLANAILWLPFPFAAALALSSWLHPHRTLETCLLVVVIALQFLLMRYVPPFGLLTGIALLVGFMIASIAVVPLGICGWIFLVAVVTAVAVLAARLLLCFPMPREDLLRTQRAFLIEARRVMDAAATALDTGQATAVRRMGRALKQLNVTTLTVDGRLAQPEVAADGDMAELLHRYLFDAELALEGIGRAVDRMTSRQVSSRLREAVVFALVIARDAPLGRSDSLHTAAELIRQTTATAPAAPDRGADDAEVRALAQRVAALLDSLADALGNWLRLGEGSPTVRVRVPFQPTVVLQGNRPAGSGPAAARAAGASSGSVWRRVIAQLRVPLQATIAGAVTFPIAHAIDPSRYYWGLVGVMVGLTGSNTTTERVRRLVHRVVGTVAGAAVGIVLVHVIGPGHVYWTLAAIVVPLALGSWGMPYRYAYFVTGLVIALVQVYGMTQPTGSLDSLLATRVLDNGLGIVVAGVCAAVVFPVSTRKITRAADSVYFSALEELITQVARRWQEPDSPVRLRGAARAVDAALLQVQSVVRPLVRMPVSVRGRRDEHLLALLGTATWHAHRLAAAADADVRLAPSPLAQVERIAEVFGASLRALHQQVAPGEHKGRWVRVSPLVGELQSTLRTAAGPPTDRLHQALLELAAMDEVLASLAADRGLTVTVPATPRAAGAGAAAQMPPTAADGGSAFSPDRQAPTAPGAVAHPSLTTGRHAAPGPDDAHGPAAARTARDAKDRTAGPARVPHPAGKHAAAPHGRQTDAAPPATRTTTSTASVSGTLRCRRHPDGCKGWIIVVSGLGKRQARVDSTDDGRYRITGLAPGAYTLIASGPAHAPRAEFLLVDRDFGTIHRDIGLQPTA
ncbi:FUSC family protein [Streptomyces sp. MMS24-I2-30]|uniref:FUSC family protein n=1 Tax=Streptomyces sp. MMS24-I2-30 TaxID=3351564 RepID=UPI003896EA29